MTTRRRALEAMAAGGLLLSRHVASEEVSAGPRRVGFISTTASNYPGYTVFREALATLGYIEGKNIRLEPRFAAGQLDRLAAFAAELVALRVDVIAVVGAVTVRAVRDVTTSIPLVFTVVLDPVDDGLVTNAQHPGGNITGVTNFDPLQPSAQMRLLKQIVPGLERVAILGDAGVPNLLDRANLDAAQAEGLHAQSIRLRGASEDLNAVFSTLKEERTGAVLGLEVPTVGLHGKRIVELATAARLPTMFPGDATAYGAMVSYGSSLWAACGRMAGMVDRILKGARPGDLPIEVVTQHKLTLNLSVARAVGVTIPPEILARADKVIT